MSEKTSIRKIAVFCGASAGRDALYRLAAYETGKVLAKEGIGIIFGGGKVGLMGALADGALDNGGEVTGVIPGFLKDKELAHPRVSQLIETETMHERKTKMNELCDGVIALPGGYGTLDELFEMLTWSQLGLHQKPIALLNVNSFFDPLLRMIQTMTDESFLKEVYRDMVLCDSEISALLKKMQEYKAPHTTKWLPEGQQ